MPHLSASSQLAKGNSSGAELFAQSVRRKILNNKLANFKPVLEFREQKTDIGEVISCP